MDISQALRDCGDNPEKLYALAESLAEEIDLAYAQDDRDRCADLHFCVSRLFEHAREHLSPADYHQFRLKVDSLGRHDSPPLV